VARPFDAKGHRIQVAYVMLQVPRLDHSAVIQLPNVGSACGARANACWITAGPGLHTFFVRFRRCHVRGALVSHVAWGSVQQELRYDWLSLRPSALTALGR
jgi:hypothetical protein